MLIINNVYEMNLQTVSCVLVFVRIKHFKPCGNAARQDSDTLTKLNVPYLFFIPFPAIPTHKAPQGRVWLGSDAATA